MDYNKNKIYPTNGEEERRREELLSKALSLEKKAEDINLVPGDTIREQLLIMAKGYRSLADREPLLAEN